MHYENLHIAQSEQIITVTINRERALNALNRRTMEELTYFFTEDAPRREDYQGIILTGAGSRSFVAGADIKEFLGLDATQGEALARSGQEVFLAIERFPRPVIAVVNGFALGGGCELAMACHLRLAVEQARFGQPEVKLGIIPGYGGTQRLVQYVGKARALELMLTGDMITATEAQQLGLVNHIYPSASIMEEARALIHKIGAQAPLAVSKIIESVNAYFDPMVDGFAYEVKAFGYTSGTEDFQEGASAFIEKRSPQFEGK